MASPSNSTSSDSDDQYKKLAVAGFVLIPVLIVLLMYSFFRFALFLVLLIRRRRRRSPVVPALAVRKLKENCNSGTLIINEDSIGYGKTKGPVKETSVLTEHDPAAA